MNILDIFKEQPPWLMPVFGTMSTVIVGKASFEFYRYRKLSGKKNKKHVEINMKKVQLLQKLVGMQTPLNAAKVIPFLSLLELQTKLATKELEAVDVLEAHQVRALETDQKLCCMTEPIYDADVTSIFLDSAPKEKQGLLHGIPTILNDFISVQGYDSTAGLLSRCFCPLKKDSVLVQVLKLNGAVPFAITNPVQTPISMETASPLFGETVNPVNKTRSCGGSCGSEAALLAQNGAVLGFGLDMLGGLRLSAGNCGICGFKPTAGRLSLEGISPPILAGCLDPAVGPLGREVDVCLLAMRSLLSPHLFRLDSTLPPLPFNEEAFNPKKLRIGMYTSLESCIDPVPAVKRAIAEAAKILTEQGHEVVLFELPDVRRAINELLWGIVCADGGASVAAFMKGESVGVGTAELLALNKWPRCLKWLKSQIIRPWSSLLSISYRSTKSAANVGEFWQLKTEIEEYKTLLLTRMDAAGLDALICPVSPSPALPTGVSKNVWTRCLAYTALYNLTNFPAGCLPVTKVTTADEAAVVTTGGDIVDRWMAGWQAGSAGLPVGIQCVARPWKDEICLRVMKDLETGLHRLDN